MKPLLKISLCICLLFLLACSGGSVCPETIPGVSLELAKHRKKTICNIAYELTVHIPDSATAPIEASEVVRFDLANNHCPVEIDFKADSTHLKSIVVNNHPVEINHNHEHIIIPPGVLTKGTNEVVISFTAGDISLHRNNNYLYTLFVPERARTFMPCFDQPDLKAVFELTVELPKQWEVVSNGPVKKQTVNNERKTVEFETSDTISTYLFSIVAGKFKKTTRPLHGMESTLYYMETDTDRILLSIDSIFYLHEISLEFLEKYTGIPYPFKKLDFIAIPDFPYGGMEHVGCIDYVSSSLFLDQTASKNDKIGRAQLIAHETAHAWFGNLVTMKWFNDVWMKEVFANYMADKILEKIMPRPDENYQFLLQHYPVAYYVDRTRGTHPIRQELDNLDKAGSLYGGIIYEKAPIVMRMLETTIGHDVMQRGLQEYLQKFSFGNADWEDLIVILDKLSKEDVQEWNDQWINRKGRPKISYTLNVKNNVIQKLTLMQNNELDRGGVWRQKFTIALVYTDSIIELPVNMSAETEEINDAIGKPAPMYMLFNSTGTGYGSFPVDSAMLQHIAGIKQPLLRATAYINLYERVLDGEVMLPADFVKLYAGNFSKENDILLLNRITRQFENIYWQFTDADTRQLIVADIEQQIWAAIMTSSTDAHRRKLFMTYLSIWQTPEAMDKVYKIWKEQKGPAGIFLSEEDYMIIAGGLAIKGHPGWEQILSGQMARIQDEQRRQKFTFLQASLSNDVKVRDRFFESLADVKYRAKEKWVSAALYNLHHPLRMRESEKYLPKTLEMLEEIQMTGGVFFPTDWLNASFAFYQEATTQQKVDEFLQAHPNYNGQLKNKILQETDDLYRSVKIKTRGK